MRNMYASSELRPSRARLLVAALSLVVLVGCADFGAEIGEPAGETEATTSALTLALAAETPEGVSVDLVYQRAGDDAAPRMMELFLEVDGELTFLNAEARDAAVAAGKQLVVQPQPDGTLRVVLYATGNTTRINGGALARLRFAASGSGKQTARLSIAERRPLFAPAESDAATAIGEPLALGEGAVQ